MRKSSCPVLKSKESHASALVYEAADRIDDGTAVKPNVIWIEATGCSGNIISFMNAQNPNLSYILSRLINLKYNNSLMGPQGEEAFEQFIDTLDTEFFLIVDGAVSTKDNGVYNVIAKYKNIPITAMEAVRLAGSRAKYVLTVGTCASYGGPSAASPNPSSSISVPEFLKRDVIRLPGCPCHPDWLAGTLSHLISFGEPPLDSDRRPIMFYGITIHDICNRRSYFDSKLFAKKPGDRECMFKIGCRGPVTKTDCPNRRWNGYVNWPIGDNTPCIGCAQPYFPDGMEPFLRY